MKVKESRSMMIRLLNESIIFVTSMCQGCVVNKEYLYTLN